VKYNEFFLNLFVSLSSETHIQVSPVNGLSRLTAPT